MTISLSLKTGTGALFLNEAGASNDLDAGALQGFATFTPEGEGSGGNLRLEVAARIVAMHGPGLRYRLAFGRGLNGFMLLVAVKRNLTDPDYSGFLGAFNELIVIGWNRSINDRPYVLLNVRENLASRSSKRVSKN